MCELSLTILAVVMRRLGILAFRAAQRKSNVGATRNERSIDPSLLFPLGAILVFTTTTSHCVEDVQEINHSDVSLYP